jgi:hypothetical protein
MSSSSSKLTIMPPAQLTRAGDRKLSPGFNRELNRHARGLAYVVRTTQAAVDSTAEVQAHGAFRAVQTLAGVNALANAALRAGHLSEEDLARLAVIGQAIPEQIAGHVDRAAAEIDYRLDQAMDAEIKTGFLNELSAWLDGS